MFDYLFINPLTPSLDKRPPSERHKPAGQSKGNRLFEIKRQCGATPPSLAKYAGRPDDDDFINPAVFDEAFKTGLDIVVGRNDSPYDLEWARSVRKYGACFSNTAKLRAIRVKNDRSIAPLLLPKKSLLSRIRNFSSN